MKQEEKTALTKQKILTAAINEFGQNGYAGGSLNNICQSGIPKGLIYHNFKNKDALYLACVKICFDQLTAYLKNAGTGGSLEKYMMARMEFFREHDAQAHIFFDAVLQPPDPLREEIGALRKELDDLNKALFRDMIAAVTLRQGITCEDAMAYFMLMQEMFNSYFSSPAYHNIPFEDKISFHETHLKKIIDLMMYGIAVRGNI
nr:TetR/AcrR family transcriptional regulator [bacterium]